MMQNHIIALTMNALTLVLLLAYLSIMYKASKLMISKFDMLNDYLKTIVTQYAENVTYAQAVVLLNIFSRAAKYKVYSMIIDEMLDNREEKTETLVAKIIVSTEAIVRDMRVNLGAFVYNKRALNLFVPKGNWEERMGMEIGDYFAEKKKVNVDERALRLELKDILAKYFDSIVIS